MRGLRPRDDPALDRADGTRLAGSRPADLAGRITGPEGTLKASDQEKPKSQPEQPKLPRSTKPEAKPEVEPVPRDRGQRIPQDVSRIPNEAL